MSAIFGIINKNGNAVDEAMINNMQQTLLHRAVDGKNIYTDENMMFGHHKLIVHRRQTYEQQPFESDNCIITCDARIDNIGELAKELDVDPSLKITAPLIIIISYKKWGKDCVTHLEGEFAFALWNKTTKEFYGASDHIGFRTFYYYENDKIFAFASEIKALEAIKMEPLELNEDIFFDHYTIIHHPITYDKNIHVIQSGHYILLAKNSQLKLERYWLARKTKKYKFKHIHEWHEYLLELLTQKIKCQIDSDYPIGILLSGGLDSSFIAAVACKLLKEQNRKLLAFSSVLPKDYNGSDKDERFYIEKLNEQYDNLEVHYVTIPDDVGPYSGLQETFNSVESPVNTFHYVERALFEAAEKSGVRTLLTGFGGDMTISYNGNGVIYDYLAKLRVLKAFKLFTRRYKIENNSLTSLIKTEILGHNPVYRRIRDLIKKNNDHTYYPLQKETAKKIIKAGKIPSRKNFHTGRLNSGEIGSILIRERKHGNAFNLEFLSPLLDKNVTELFFDIPGEHLLSNGIKRSLIKETMKNLVPKEIINRMDKMPFSPDYNKRIGRITKEYVEGLYRSKYTLDGNVKINFNRLYELIAQIDRTKLKSDWKINKDLFFIPTTIIAAEFQLWLNKRKT